jgi:hypothetical protein
MALIRKPTKENVMNTKLIIALAATLIALTAAQLPAYSAQADDDDDDQPGNKTPCIVNADGAPGKNNQGPGAGQGGKAGTIILNGKLPDGCVSASGGKGGNNNRGSNAGQGGNGGTIKF